MNHRLEMLKDKDIFCRELHARMVSVAPVCSRMEPYEFRYALNTITPTGGWDSITLDPRAVIEQKIATEAFYASIEIKPREEGRIVLDRQISGLTQMLFVGLVTDEYPQEWVKALFYFDPRGFNFLVRSIYQTEEIKARLGGSPYCSFARAQKAFELSHEVGYQEFMHANSEVDGAFIDILLKLVEIKRTPILLAIAGPTAAGKTEIVDRLRVKFEEKGQKIAAVELDNFLLDRDYREEQGIGSFGVRALHFELLKACLKDLLAGNTVQTPRYDFINATSSHDLQSRLKPDGVPVVIEPADILFLEGNSPFLFPELAELVEIKVVYLTDDPVRLKRKWRRDIDYRKKYDPYYLRNRFFKEQPPMAVKNYQPQLLLCDVYVNTTEAEVWLAQSIRRLLEENG